MVPNTVAASTLLVPSPLPAGIAESNVISIPQPKAMSCDFRSGYFSCEYCGKKPANANAALGIEKGLPTRLKSASCS